VAAAAAGVAPATEGASAAMRGVVTTTSAFWARWRSAWSISVSASIDSQIGVARMPTQGSWRPVVSTITGAPLRSMERLGSRIDEVGFTATCTTRSWPVEMPPSTPPALLDRKPSGVISSPCTVPGCVTASKPAPISTPFTALMFIML
jgi:hypothetical protein